MKTYKLRRDYVELGAFMQKARHKSKLTQREVSDKLGYSSAQFISNFERGIAPPPLGKLKTLIKLYKMNQTKVVEAILAGERARLQDELK